MSNYLTAAARFLAAIFLGISAFAPEGLASNTSTGSCLKFFEAKPLRGPTVLRSISDRIQNDLSRQPVINMPPILKQDGRSLSVPSLVFDANNGFRNAGRLTTRTIVVHGDETNIESQLGLVRFASRHFKRRWNDEDFLDEREQIARNYKDRSIYLAQESITPEHELHYMPRLWNVETQLQGSLGITFAKTTRREIDALSEKELLSQRDLILPQEEVLQKPLTRYYDSQGRSIIVELRAYAKDPKADELLLKSLRSDMVSLTFHTIQEYPELYDKPIVYTYGDEVSIRMYKSYGFHVQEHLTPLDQPLRDKRGKPWWILAATPRDLEASLLLKLGGARWVLNLNQPYPVLLPNGQKALAAPGTSLAVNKNNIASHFIPNETTEVSSGVFAMTHSSVDFHGSGNLKTISIIGKNPYGIPEQSYVRFLDSLDKSGRPKIESVGLHDEVMRIPQLNILVTGYFRFSTDRISLDVVTPASDLKLGDGKLIAGKGTQILDLRKSISRPGQLECDRLTLARDTELDGVQYRKGETLDVRWIDGLPKIYRVYPARNNPN